ncbi:MAG: septal ring lytic transglycosylase RlpA family protein [Rubrobacter sp.]
MSFPAGKKIKGAVAGFAAVCVTATGMAVAASPAQAEPVVSSFYGYELAGSPTASGVPFDPMALTAAHPSLPFGTQLEVCYQGCVTVTVNDRGPFVEGRGLDLSQGAAEAIGLSGVDTVEMNVVGSEGDVSGSVETTDAVATEQAGYEAAASYSDPYSASAYFAHY